MDSNSLIPRIEDTFNQSVSKNKPCFLGFLSAEEASVALNRLEHKTKNFSFYGGYDSAQRTLLCCYPDWFENPIYPITTISFNYRNCDKLSHRDFLGSLMALGITRESIGDILVGEGKAVAFFKTDIANFVLTQISKIGRVGVTLESDYKGPLPQTDKFTELSATVSSNRLDSVVSALGGVSRATAQEFINDGRVNINSFLTKKCTVSVQNGANLSIRGKGKFTIISVDNTTKKGRIVLQYKKYI